MPLPTLLVVIVLGTGELASIELGQPLDPEITPETRVELILADYDSRRDLIWDLDPAEASAAFKARLERGNLRPGDLIHVIQALGVAGRPTASEAVEKYIGDPSSALRLAVIRSLGQMGKFSSVPLIEPFLQNADPQFRRAALIALGKFGKPELIPDLEAAAKRDAALIPLVQDAKRRVDSIAKQNFPAFVDAVIDTDEWEDILPLLMVTWRPLIDLLAQKQRGPVVRLRAAKMLAWGHMRRAGQNLSAIVADPLDPADLRLQAIIALGRCRIRSSAPQLIALLNSPDQTVQSAAITSLGQLGVAEALDPLLKKWNDRGGANREALRLAIRRSCSVSGSELLKDLLATNGSLASSKIYFIDPSLNLTDSFHTDLIDPWLSAASPSARGDAALLLSFFGGPADAPKLERLRSDPDLANRELADRGVKRLRSSAPK
jgi:HEAT repeat protein